jgi:plastocyanin
VRLLALLSVVAPLSAAAAELRGRALVGDESEGNVGVILDALDGDTPPAAPAERRLDEVWLSFVPKVQVAPVGSTLRLDNHDDESHTVHGFFGRRTLFNLATVPRGQEQRVVLDRPGVVTVACDLHSYMRAYVLVTRSAFSAVSATDGTFAIEGVPPGRYRVRVWRPHDPGAVDGEPGAVFTEVDVGAAAPPLLLRLPPAPPDPMSHEMRQIVAHHDEHRPRPPAWLHAPTGEWPTRTGWVLFVSALGIVGGILLAIGNLRLAAQRGWSLGVAVVTNCGLAFLAGVMVVVGLHGAVATALGFGLFIGTVIFGAEERRG